MRVLLLTLLLTTTTGCPEQGVVCRQGQAACADVCVDLQADVNNCGACGITCGDAQVCQAGACACPSDRAECFDSHGVCTDTQADVAHCGACGNACASGELCEAGACVLDCSEGKTECGGACVNTQTSAQHCGACGNACAQGMSCQAGTCGFDVIAACLTNGQLRGFRADTLELAPLRDHGAGPQALARFGDDVLLSVDATDAKLYQARYPSLEELPSNASLGAAPNHLLVDGEYVYALNSVAHTLQILRPSAPATEEGVPFEAVGELDLGENTYPQVMAQVGQTLYVTLLGDSGAGAAAGQKVVAVDLTDKTKPVAGDTWDLMGLTEPFTAGGESFPRPQGIVHHDGKLYVALNNSDSFFGTAGPSAVAVISLSGGEPTAIPLPSDTCRNAGWIRTVDGALLVGCQGQADYSMWPVVLTTHAGVALIQDDEVKAVFEVSCPAGSTPDECADPSVGRFDVIGGRVFAGDQAAGRLYVAALDTTAGTLTPVRTHEVGGGPLEVCPVDATTGYSNVGDVLATGAR